MVGEKPKIKSEGFNGNGYGKYADRWERAFKSFLLVTLSLIFIAILGYLDYVTNPYFSFQIFYLIPIVLVVWFGGKWLSIFPLSASAIAWLYDDIMGFHMHIHPLIPLWNLFAKIAFFYFAIEILSRFKKMLDREKLFAGVDYLTETANKKYFYDMVAREISRTNRYKQPITIAYIDLDDFKRINDTFGHLVGDKTLRLTAEVLKKNVRASDTVARIGGDEFAILFPHTGYESARIVIRRLQSEFSNIIETNLWPTTSVSIGVITCLTHPCVLESLVADADNLMYAAKREGKSRTKHVIVGKVA